MQLPDFGPTLDDYWSGLKVIVTANKWWLLFSLGCFVLGGIVL